MFLHITSGSTITATSVRSMTFDKFFNFSKTQFPDLPKIGLIRVRLSPQGCGDEQMRCTNLSTQVQCWTKSFQETAIISILITINYDRLRWNMPLLNFYLLSHILLSIATQTRSAFSAWQPFRDLNPYFFSVYNTCPMQGNMGVEKTALVSGLEVWSLIRSTVVDSQTSAYFLWNSDFSSGYWK